MVFYSPSSRKAHHYPSFFDVPLVNGWLDYSQSRTLSDQTGFPNVDLVVYEPDRGVWLPILHGGGLFVEQGFNPWVLIRTSRTRDEDCFCLDTAVRHVRDILTRTYVVIHFVIGANKFRYYSGINPTLEGDGSEFEWNGTQQMMVIDDDDEDLDYVDGASDVDESEAVMDTEDEESGTEMEEEMEDEEAVETEDEETEDEEGMAETGDEDEVEEAEVRRVTIDLTLDDQMNAEEEMQVALDLALGDEVNAGEMQVTIDLTREDDEDVVDLTYLSD